MTALHDVATLSSSDLLAITRALAQTACSVEAELLVHLGEIDDRKLYLDCAFSSMFAFCTSELGFSEYAAYNRIMVARAARRLPALLDAIRSGQVHLAGARAGATSSGGANRAASSRVAAAATHTAEARRASAGGRADGRGYIQDP